MLRFGSSSANEDDAAPAAILRRVENRQLRHWAVPVAIVLCFPLLNGVITFTGYHILFLFVSELLLLDLFLFAVAIHYAAARMRAWKRSGIHEELKVTTLEGRAYIRLLTAGILRRWVVCLLVVEFLQGVSVLAILHNSGHIDPDGLTDSLLIVLLMICSTVLLVWFHFETVRLVHVVMLGMLGGRTVLELGFFLVGLWLTIFVCSALFTVLLIGPLVAAAMKLFFSVMVSRGFADAMELEAW